MILIERLQKYQLYHQARSISMNILLAKKYYLLIMNKLNLLILLWEKLLKNRQTNTIKYQGEKQMEAIQDNKKQLANINDDYKNKLLLSKEREIFKNIYNERLDKIEELNKKSDYNNLKHTVINTGEEFEFDKSEVL